MTRAFAIVVLFIAQISYAQAEEVRVHLRLSTQNPPTVPSVQILEHFKQRVEAESKGAIAIEIFDSGRLYSDDEVGKAVSSGAIEIGFVNQAWYAATIPGVDIFQLPFMFNSDALLAAARTPRSEIRTIIDQAILAKEGARVLFWVSQGQMVLVSHTTSLTNPGRIAGRTVRAAGPVMHDFISKCGGIPKKIKLTDMPNVYERHEVEIGMHAVTVVAGFKLWTVFDKLTKTHHASAQYVVAINEKTWQSLSEGQRAIITEAARAVEIEATDHAGGDDAAAYQQIANDGRLKVEALTDEELMLWRICSSDVLAEYVAHSGELGGELIAAYGRLLQLDERPQKQKAPRLSAK
jgi:TRAP-type C4-dicarboxylate transport system substrate-binding protein